MFDKFVHIIRPDSIFLASHGWQDTYTTADRPTIGALAWQSRFLLGSRMESCLELALQHGLLTTTTRLREGSKQALLQ